jgi:hypothetical protein
MRELTCVVKENAAGTPFLALEPGGIHLSFGRWVTIDEAHDTARQLRKVFAAGALGSCSQLDGSEAFCDPAHCCDDQGVRQPQPQERIDGCYHD